GARQAAASLRPLQPFGRTDRVRAAHEPPHARAVNRSRPAPPVPGRSDTVDPGMSAHPGNAALRGGIGLEFSLRRDADGGTLALADERLFGWLSLEGLELAVPAFALPPDDPVAPEIFQRRRSRARSARLRMSQDDLDRYVAGLGEAMAEVGVDELRVALGDGAVAISARVREAAQVADLTL